MRTGRGGRSGSGFVGLAARTRRGGRPGSGFVGLVALAVLGLLASPGCAGTSGSAAIEHGPAAIVAAESASPNVADRLFLGRAIPGGGTVADEDWAGFVRDVVSPRFPDGFTVWRAAGQWRDPSGVVVSEDTIVLEILHGGSPAEDRAVGEIADAYKRRFRQDAVLRATSPARVRFHE